eukprot:Clim_evm10s221 gene=Clim_evmTU10s221
MRVAGLVSGGKDSVYSMCQCIAAGHQIVALINLRPDGDTLDVDSYMYQSIGHEAVTLLPQCLPTGPDGKNVPLFRGTLSKDGSRNRDRGYDHAKPVEGDEVEELFRVVKECMESTGIEAMCSGAVLSDYQRVRVEGVCARLGLLSIAPIWRYSQRGVLEALADAGINAIMAKCASMGLRPDRDLGKNVATLQTIARFSDLNEQFGFHEAGEGGEYETIVLDCPIFSRGRLVIDEAEIKVSEPDPMAPIAHYVVKRISVVKPQDESQRLAFMEKIKEHIAQQTTWKAPPLSSGWANSISVDSRFHERMVFARNAPSESCSVVAVDEHKTHGGLSLWNIALPLEPSRKQADAILEHIQDAIRGDVVFVHLTLKRMTDFPDINQRYQTIFGLLNPPSRSCVEVNTLEEDCRIVLITASRDAISRSAMHVQSYSHWAPANIGPYSQCQRLEDSRSLEDRSVGNLYLTSGQIGLVPFPMTPLMPRWQQPPNDQARDLVWSEITFAARHAREVLLAHGCSKPRAILAICYVVPQLMDVSQSILLEAMRLTFIGKQDKHVLDDENDLSSPELTVMRVGVSGLPRDVNVEWELTAVDQPITSTNSETTALCGPLEITLSGWSTGIWATSIATILITDAEHTDGKWTWARLAAALKQSITAHCAAILPPQGSTPTERSEGGNVSDMPSTGLSVVVFCRTGNDADVGYVEEGATGFGDRGRMNRICVDIGLLLGQQFQKAVSGLSIYDSSIPPLGLLPMKEPAHSQVLVRAKLIMHRQRMP